jgi:hypothetical protein
MYFDMSNFKLYWGGANHSGRHYKDSLICETWNGFDAIVAFRKEI